jgi:glycosyltransferase involved in cell wall biosynthesis
LRRAHLDWARGYVVNISGRAEHFSTKATVLNQAFQLPVVSIIIVNYNYGRFLDQAVDSVFQQTYPHVECIVVDNASTDESPGVLAAISDRYPQAIVIQRAHNDGQTPASLDGLAASSGAYVVFMDADDVLLAHAVETHIFVHLSMRVHVGFTSGDMLQVTDGQIVVGTGEALNRYVRSGRGRRGDLVRPYRHRLDSPWPPAPVAKSLIKKIHFVPPLSSKWTWSPTSGICYRRDALHLFSDNPELNGLRTGTDMYFACAISALCGSVIIDEPVFIYRIHDSNVYSRRPQLNHFIVFEAGGVGDSNQKSQLLIIDHLIAKAERFCRTSWLRLHYGALLIRVDQRDDDSLLPLWQRRSRAARRLMESNESVVAALGYWLTILLMICLRVPISVIARAIRKHK